MTSPVQRSLAKLALLATRSRRKLGLSRRQAHRRAVDRFLPQRSKALALERRRAESDFAAEEEGLEAVVGGAREQHAAQDLEAFVARQRRGDRGAAEEAVDRVEQLGVRLLHARGGGRPRRRVRQPVRKRARLQPLLQLAPQRRTRGLDRRFVSRVAAAGRRLEGVEHIGERKRMPLGDERAEAARDAGQLLELSRLWHKQDWGPGARTIPRARRQPRCYLQLRERRLKIIRDFGRQDIAVAASRYRLTCPNPEQVEAQLVALEQLVVVVAAPTPFGE